MGWASANGLTVNNSKCNFILLARGSLNLQTAYMIGKVSLGRVDYIRDLGVMIDSTMSFDAQISTVVKKCLKILGFMKNASSDFRRLSTLVHLYKSLLLPILTYCSSI